MLSDIHGNIYALNAVLKNAKEKSVDFIYCLGDMIGIGPFTTEVLDALFELENIQMITGNHDESVLAVLKNEPYPKSRINVTPHHEWISEKLKIHHITALESLSRILTPTFHGQNFHLIHYPMNPSMYKAHISKDPFDLVGTPSPKNFSNVSGLSDFSLICFGHDHKEHHFEWNDRTFYNSGSLGCFNEPYARYGIIDIDKNGFHIMQQYVPYELVVYINELRKIDFPRKDVVLRIYE
ncbi:metallophosphoesterase family protein [Virgibacillus halodenitrificans]|uniref:metallophosphoesterase family protein n=1 Tax=Virgibacillus halodenitrificans TaxID=1482 RepID=UPI00301CD0A2